MKLLRHWPWCLALGIVLVITISMIPPMRQNAEFHRVFDKGGRLTTEPGKLSQSMPRKLRVFIDQQIGPYEWLTYFDTVTWAKMATPAFNNDDLKRVSRFSMLQGIELQDSSVTDEGLLHLRGLREIEELNLRNTRITDTGLEPLRDLKSLEGIYLHNTSVTAEGVNRLKEALPDCEIYY